MKKTIGAIIMALAIMVLPFRAEASTNQLFYADTTLVSVDYGDGILFNSLGLITIEWWNEIPYFRQGIDVETMGYRSFVEGQGWEWIPVISVDFQQLWPSYYGEENQFWAYDWNTRQMANDYKMILFDHSLSNGVSVIKYLYFDADGDETTPADTEDGAFRIRIDNGNLVLQNKQSNTWQTIYLTDPDIEARLIQMENDITELTHKIANKKDKIIKRGK